MSDENARGPTPETAEPGSGPSGQVNLEPVEASPPRLLKNGLDPREAQQRSRLTLQKVPDLREHATWALKAIGRAGLRQIKSLEARAAAGVDVPPNALSTAISSASRPWEKLLDAGIKADEAKFAREELEAGKKLLMQVRREKRRTG
jgi:hypothetical protein